MVGDSGKNNCRWTTGHISTNAVSQGGKAVLTLAMDGALPPEAFETQANNINKNFNAAIPAPKVPPELAAERPSPPSWSSPASRAHSRNSPFPRGVRLVLDGPEVTVRAKK